jgi:hypothetical protein
MKYAVEVASCGMIYIPSFMKIGIGVQAILRFYLSSLKGCHVGIVTRIPVARPQHRKHVPTRNNRRTSSLGHARNTRTQ